MKRTLAILFALLAGTLVVYGGTCQDWPMNCASCGCNGCQSNWQPTEYKKAWLDPPAYTAYTNCYMYSPFNCAGDIFDCCLRRQIFLSRYLCSVPHYWSPTYKTRCCYCWGDSCWGIAKLRRDKDAVYYVKRVLGFLRGSNRAT